MTKGLTIIELHLPSEVYLRGMTNPIKHKQGFNRLKIIIAGHFGAGKTTFVKTLAGGDFVSSEKKTTQKGEAKRKRTTTVAMDFATYQDGDTKFYVYGLPGQYRFKFMWEILAKNADGIIMLIDSTDPVRWPELFRQFLLFKKLNPESAIVFAANKQDHPLAMSPSEIKNLLNILQDSKYHIIPLSSQDRNSVIYALKFIKKIIEEQRGLKKTVKVDREG